MRLPLEDLLKILAGEVYSRRNTVFVLFVVISLSFLAVGTIWPKRYTSFSIILADESNILQPLMQGTAETTRVTDFVGNAREIIFGENIMDKILEEAGWLKTNPSEVEKERIKNKLKDHIKINGIGNNLISFEYRDSKPMRAYITAKRVAELFIEEGEKSKINESRAAYDFIEKQVNEYLGKLTEVEEQLREFRSNNPNTRPGLETEVSNRITRITTDIEKNQLQLRETEIRRDSLRKQLSGEAAITISQSKEGQYRAKIAELQANLETLRLDYKETYPDILRLKHQIEDLKHSMTAEIEKRRQVKSQGFSANSDYIDESIILNPLYQKLRSDASATETKIATLHARISEMNKMLEKEYDRARRIHGGEASLAKLTRNYQVNQEIYQDLLRRLERARVSKNLDQENQGLTFKVQEPAKIPLLPTGIRFVHFAAVGLLAGLAIPIGIIYLLLQVDPRVRFSQIISSELNIPVLAEIKKIESLSDKRKTRINLLILGTGTTLVFVIYGYVGWLKFTGQL